MKNKDICNKIKELISNNKEVIAIFNNGSSVIGLDTENSDVDFVIIIKKNKDREKLLQTFRNKFRIIKNEINPEIEIEEQFYILGKRIDLTLITRDEIEKRIYSFYNSVEAFLELQHFLKHKIIDAIDIYDPNNLLKSYQKEIKKYPEKIFKEVFNKSINQVKETLFYFENHTFRNEFQYAFEQWEILQPICEALYSKNRQLLMLPFKRLHNDLQTLKPNIEEEMYQLIQGNNNPQVITKKIKIIKKILKKLEA